MGIPGSMRATQMCDFSRDLSCSHIFEMHQTVVNLILINFGTREHPEWVTSGSQ